MQFHHLYRFIGGEANPLSRLFLITMMRLPPRHTKRVLTQGCTWTIGKQALISNQEAFRFGR
jgi:hypothetical protein